MTFIDSHTHLFYEDFRNDLPEVIARARAVGVDRFIVPATNLSTAREAIALAESIPGLYAAVGYHPLDLKEFTEEGMQEIERLTTHSKVVAVGEIGIDYFYDTSPRDVQMQLFERQIALAVRTNLPIIVHTRDSVPDAIDLVVRMTTQNPSWSPAGGRGVFHCFTGDAAQAQMLFEHDFLVSFPGPITFKKGTMGEVVRQIGLDRIMVETDAPFLTPVPFRGKRNEPSFIPLIATKIAEILGVSVDEVAARTTENAVRLFQLPASL